jgi:hypothetical protein
MKPSLVERYRPVLDRAERFGRDSRISGVPRDENPYAGDSAHVLETIEGGELVIALRLAWWHGWDEGWTSWGRPAAR